MSNLLHSAMGQHADHPGGKRVEVLSLKLPSKGTETNAGLVQAFFPEFFLTESGGKVYNLKIELEAESWGKSQVFASASVKMQGDWNFTPPLSLLAKIDLLSQEREVKVFFKLEAESSVKLHIGSGAFPAPWTAGLLTALLVKA